MARHIQHRYTTNTEHTFNSDELLIGEIGINAGKGTLSIIDDKNNTHNIISEVDGQNHIIHSTEEPSEEYRDNYLWLHDTGDNVITDESIVDIRTMLKAICELTRAVNRHERAFSNVMNCGTVTENNTRTTLMKSAVPEAPEGYFDGTTPILISEYDGEKNISTVTNHFLSTNLSYGVELDTQGWLDYLIPPDSNNPYLWNYRTIIYDNETIEQTEPELILKYSSARIIIDLINYYALSDSSSTYPEKDNDTYSENIPVLTNELPYLWNYVKPEYLVDEETDKPEYEDYTGANVKHLVIKSSQTEQEIRDNFENILNNELIWCEGNNGLYIKSKNKLVKINGTSSINPDDDDDNDDIMTGITFLEDGVGAIDFISTNGTKYTMKVNDNGKLSVYNDELNHPIEKPSGNASGNEGDEVNGLFLQKLYINSVYCSGDLDSNGNEINEHSINPCSHNFVELSNLTQNDINLNGLSLQYATNGTNWKVLPLWGKIKAGSTFLIRGAQCSIMNLNTTVIKVNDYDMEWRDTDGSLIKFSNKGAKFYLRYGTEPCDVNNPYLYNSTTPAETKLKYGYIDLVGFDNGSGNNPGGYENTAYTPFNSTYLLRKYYSMDNVSQATKAIDKRNNKNDWYYINLNRNDIIPNIEAYTPRASSYGKNIFYDKTPLKENKPTIATISFGIQATDNGNGATRCFNWVSKGYYNEYLWYRQKGESNWIRIESFNGSTDDINKYYNRITQEATNGQVFTSHKVIVKNLPGVPENYSGDISECSGVTYEYTCGKSLDDENPDMDGCIDIREFIVRHDDYVNKGFSFIQITDQQGFNWDEYQVWYYSAKYISENHNDTHFLINTGDMTQNGNRLNEWFDYFNGKSPLNNLEEMATIGNNDLCPKIVYQLGDGGDASKINFANINFFFTFEIDSNNPPIFADGDLSLGYIPSLYSFNYGNVHFICLNSEISERTETDIIGVVNNKGIVYNKIKTWCENDIANNSGNWNIAYCHEMPFTIITNSVMSDFYDPQKNDGKEVPSNNIRGGSRINMTTKANDRYWFSRFCQENNIRLVMGGHKHTQAISWPIKENYTDNEGTLSFNSMKPIIQVTANDLTESFNGSTKLIQIVDESDLNGQKFPNKWFNESSQNNNEATRNDINDEFETRCHYCTFELVENITAPIYSMSQATGYKHTSNKELPGTNIPWCRYYYPNNNGKVNNEQRYPFYSIYNITSDQITIDVKRVKEVLVGGKFNINEQGENIKNGKFIVTTDNGLSSSNDYTNNKKVTINK